MLEQNNEVGEGWSTKASHKCEIPLQVQWGGTIYASCNEGKWRLRN